MPNNCAYCKICAVLQGSKDNTVILKILANTNIYTYFIIIRSLSRFFSDIDNHYQDWYTFSLILYTLPNQNFPVKHPLCFTLFPRITEWLENKYIYPPHCCYLSCVYRIVLIILSVIRLQFCNIRAMLYHHHEGLPLTTKG